MRSRIRSLAFVGAGAAAAILAIPPYVESRDARKEDAARSAEEARQKSRKELLGVVPRSLKELPPKYSPGAKLVSNVLLSEREVPDEFHAVVEEDGRIWIFHLWHLGAYDAKRDAAARGLSVIGNPGGRCRSIEFDTLSGKASPSKFWQ